jgi:hypothetical protein
LPHLFCFDSKTRVLNIRRNTNNNLLFHKKYFRSVFLLEPYD